MAEMASHHQFAMDNLMNIDRPVLVGGIILWNLFLISTTVLFIYLRSNLTIKFRNVPLTFGGVLSTALVSNTYLATELFPGQVPCYFVLWVLSLGAPFWFLTFFGKYFLLAFSYQLARSKMKVNLHSVALAHYQAGPGVNNLSNYMLGDFRDAEPSGGNFDGTKEEDDKKWLGQPNKLGDVYNDIPKVELGRSWYHQNRNRWTTQSVIVCIVILLGFHAVVAALTQWLTPEYNVNAEPRLNCIKGVGMIPLFATAILYFGLGGPALALLMWRAKDAYLLKMELILLVISTSPFILLFLMFTYTPSLEERFYPANFLLVFHLLTHLASILLPTYDVYRNSVNRTSPNNLDRFHRMLNDRDQFQDFKEFTVSDLTIENPLFYEEYMAFLKKYDPDFSQKKKDRTSNNSQLNNISLSTSAPGHRALPSLSARSIGKISKSILPNFIVRRWISLSSTVAVNTVPPPLPSTSPSTNTCYSTSSSTASSSPDFTSSSLANMTSATITNNQVYQKKTINLFPSLSKATTTTTATAITTCGNTDTFDLEELPRFTNPQPKRNAGGGGSMRRPVTSEEARDLIRLYEKFIAPGADYQLNLLGTTVKRIKQKMDQHEYDRHILDPVLDEVLDSMYRNTFIRFSKSLQF